jgi:hypothetical protein
MDSLVTFSIESITFQFAPYCCKYSAKLTDCHGNQIPYLSHICFRTILKPTAFHIGKGVALDA